MSNVNCWDYWFLGVHYDTFIVMPKAKKPRAQHLTKGKLGQILPEKLLCIAMIRQAVTDLTHPEYAKGYRSALRWLFHEDEEPKRPLGFKWVCEALDLRPEKVREEVVRIVEHDPLSVRHILRV